MGSDYEGKKNPVYEVSRLNILNVAIEHGETGVWYGRIIELLGTHARAASKTDLLSELKAELSYHIDWLNKHGAMTEFPNVEKWNVKEEVTDVKELGESGGEVALFDFDQQRVDEKLLKTAIRFMRFNRFDLLDLCMNLDEEKLRFKPSGKRRCIAEILNHVCNAEEFYISRLGEDADYTYETYLGMPVSEADGLSIFPRLEVVRDACIKTLQQLIPFRCEGIFQREEYTNYPAEKWTAFKIMRRFLEHEREHIYNIRSYLNIPTRFTK